MNDCGHRNISMIIALIVCLIAVYRFDWILLGVECCYLVFCAFVTKKYSELFHRAVYKSASIISIFLALILVVYESGEMDSYYYGGIHWIYILECLFVPVLSFIVGFMFAVVLDKHTESHFSKRWLIVFAQVFAMAVSGIEMFMVGFSIWYEDMAFFRADTKGTDHYTDRLLMVAPNAAVISAIASAIVTRRLVKAVDKTTFLARVSP